MSEWNAMTYEGKDTILRVVRREADEMFTLAEQPGAWNAPTACESWQVKDVIGHVVDTTEGYFQAFDTARSGAEAPPPYGLAGMHERAGQSAQAIGTQLSQQEMMARARTDLNKMMGILEPLTADEWSGLIVPHFYMGPVPAFVHGRPVDGLRRAHLGHQAGQRQGARASGGYRRPTRSVHVHHLAVDNQSGRRSQPVHHRDPRQRTQRRRLPGVYQ